MEYSSNRKGNRDNKKFFTNIYSNTELIINLTKREIKTRYKGSKFGLLWSFINPLIMLLIYTFVFSVVFQAKWGGAQNNKLEFALLLFCGISSFNLFSETVMAAPRLILNNVNYVKKIIFPLEILPFVPFLSAVFNLVINIGILIISSALFLGVFNWTFLFFPIVLLPMMLISMGISWFIASLGVFIRDIGYLLTLLIQALMFMSPIFYPISAVPKEFQALLYFNPMSYIVEDMRRIMIWGQMPNWYWITGGTLVGLIITLLGYTWFQKTKGGFADVL